MNIRQLNESISEFYANDILEESDIENDIGTLRRLLTDKVNFLKTTGQTNPQIQAMALQTIVEDIFQKSWWEVTDCNIAGELGSGVSLDEIVECIIDHIKPEFKETKVVTEGVNDEYYVGDAEGGRMYKGESNAKRAFNYLKAQGIDAVMYPAEDISCKKNITEDYDEPELLGKGHTAPISMDYVSDIQQRVKYKDTDFTDIQKRMNKTLDEIESFDNYWRTHKAAIMKNIKDAQDFIPVEYRI